MSIVNEILKIKNTLDVTEIHLKKRDWQKLLLELQNVQRVNDTQQFNLVPSGIYENSVYVSDVKIVGVE